MATVTKQIQSADEAICRNIESLADQRALLSQNVLAQLRNLVEGVAVRLHTGSPDAEFDYSAVDPGLAFVKSNGKLNFLGRFHKLIQQSASHYTLDGDASERLMLKYYEYLCRIRSLLQDRCGLAVLRNLEDFPVDLDPSLREYHEKIATRIDLARLPPSDSPRDRYYIHKGNSEKDFLIWQNTATPPTEFPDEADDLRRRRVRWQAQANPQGVVPDRDGSGGAVEGLDCFDRATLSEG
ncbi:hypothetical protein [Pseudomonas sp. PI1]|uniref:hypothetical protein n=1 Tax=Pseudomonas sp. PI1 TaxID=1582493 RepID=UPI001F47D0A2|nr:hypothetical protein [Pseudomonas sp. PI1]